MKKWMIPTLLLSWIAIALSVYFYVFSGPLSTVSGDWGSFGSYISGVITVPFSVISAYFLYQTYKDTQRSYFHALRESKVNEAHDAIREAASYLESALDSKITIDNDELSFREVNYNPRAAREILAYVKSHDDLNAHYRVTIGKAFLCLYDFLGSSEKKYGQTDVIKFYKIQYQWIIHIHNKFELGVIENVESGVFSRDIEEYFYNI